MACTSGREDSAVHDALFDLFKSDASITSPLLSRGGQIAFGRHESSVYVFPESSIGYLLVCTRLPQIRSEMRFVSTSVKGRGRRLCSGIMRRRPMIHVKYFRSPSRLLHS